MIQQERPLSSLLRTLCVVVLALLGALAPALAQVPQNNCSATLTASAGGYLLHVPYVVYGGSGLTADLEGVPSSDGNVWFRLRSAALVSDAAPYAACIADTLSSALYLNLPEVRFGAASFSASLVLVPGGPIGNATDTLFKLTGAGPINYIAGSRAFAGGLSIGSAETLVVKNASSPTSTTLEIQGDFVCRGDIDIWDSAATVRFNISGKATLGCSVRFSTDDPANRVIFVVGGGVDLVEGFSTPSTGHVIVTDNASLIRLPDDYLTDSTTDDGVTPSIMPAGETASAARSAALAPLLPRAGGCSSTHTLRGGFAPPAHRRVLSQGRYDGQPVVLAAWFDCDVVVDNVRVDPPGWDDLPASERSERNGGAGRKGLTLNLNSRGKIRFNGNSFLTLMNGGRGQDQRVTGNPAVARGGNGGASGDLKIAAAAGFDFSNGTLTIIPGRGGDGGNAVATGTAGANGCPGQPGGNATATGGGGADERKVLKARGFDPGGKVFVGDIRGGNGGRANATGGAGGAGSAGQCNGGAGGHGSTQAGKGGDASFRYSGTGTLAAPLTVGGDAGSTVAVSGRGGDGGNRQTRCDLGGNGGNGGNSTARSGVVGTGVLNGADGMASASTGNGTGGLCGNYRSSNGSGGAWAEYLAGVLQGSGRFDPGARDCSCTLAEAPRISVTPGEFVFVHDYGVSTCPQAIGQFTIGNGGGGSFNWRLDSLPAWLMASRSSGMAGDSVQLSFTCTGWSPSMSTTLSITGTDTATGQALPQGATLPVAGSVRQ